MPALGDSRSVEIQASEPKDAEANTSDEAPQQHTDTTTDSGSGSPDKPLNDEE